MNRLARVYRRSDTDISAVLRALVATREFKASGNQKVRRPVDDLVATAKVLGVDVAAPTTDSSWASVATYLHGGNRLYFWSRPDGPTLEDPAWCSAGRIFDSFRMHFAQVAGTWPTEATYRSTLSWQPPGAVSLVDFVDHLSRLLLGTPADERIRAVGTAALPDYADVPIGQDSPLPPYHVWRLLIALLDTPDHMTR